MYIHQAYICTQFHTNWATWHASSTAARFVEDGSFPGISIGSLRTFRLESKMKSWHINYLIKSLLKEWLNLSFHYHWEKLDHMVENRKYFKTIDLQANWLHAKCPSPISNSICLNFFKDTRTKDNKKKVLVRRMKVQLVKN